MKNVLIIFGSLITVSAAIYFFALKPSSVIDTNDKIDPDIGVIVPRRTDSTTTQSTRPMEGQYSFGLSVCEEVPEEMVANIIDQSIQETESLSTSTDTSCKYFTDIDKNEFVLIQVSYLPAENQKKGQEMMGRIITGSQSIPMEHFIAMQEDEQINAIYLVMTPEKFVRVDRTSKNVDNDQLLNLATQVAIIILGQ